MLIEKKFLKLYIYTSYIHFMKYSTDIQNEIKINNCSLIKILAMRMERTDRFEYVLVLLPRPYEWVACTKRVKK